MNPPLPSRDFLTEERGWTEVRRYGLCCLVVLSLALGAATLGLTADKAGPMAADPADAVLVDLLPALATSSQREMVSEGDRQSAVDAAPNGPMPKPIVALPPEPDVPPPPEAPRPVAVLDVKKEPQPQPTPAAEAPRPAREDKAPPGSEAPTEGAVAIESEASRAAARRAVTDWQRALVQKLEQAKKGVTNTARRSDTVVLSFSIDPAGNLVSASVTQASGSPALDQAALALLRRAAPFPKAPTGTAAQDLSFTVPVVFQHRRSP